MKRFMPHVTRRRKKPIVEKKVQIQAWLSPLKHLLASSEAQNEPQPHV